MRTVLAGVVVIGFVVLVNVAAAGVWALLGHALNQSGIDSPWAGLAMALLSVGAALWVAKCIMEWPRRGRGRARE